MAWQVYKGDCEGIRGARISTPAATMSKTGYLRISRAVVEKMPDIRTVEILFDLDAEPAKLGLKLQIEPNGNYTRKLSEGSEKGGGLGFGFKRFWTEKLGRDLDETRRFPAFYDESKRMVVVTLEPMGKGGRR